MPRGWWLPPSSQAGNPASSSGLEISAGADGWAGPAGPAAGMGPQDAVGGASPGVGGGDDAPRLESGPSGRGSSPCTCPLPPPAIRPPARASRPGGSPVGRGRVGRRRCLRARWRSNLLAWRRESPPGLPRVRTRSGRRAMSFSVKCYSRHRFRTRANSRRRSATRLVATAVGGGRCPGSPSAASAGPSRADLGRDHRPPFRWAFRPKGLRPGMAPPCSRPEGSRDAAGGRGSRGCSRRRAARRAAAGCGKGGAHVHARVATGARLGSGCADV